VEIAASKIRAVAPLPIDLDHVVPDDGAIDLARRLQELRAYYDGLIGQPRSRDALPARDFQEALIASYERVLPLNRGLNDKRYHYRALAASHLVRSLLWALGATPVIFVSDKIGLLPRISP
jgi:hypothetical protein